MSPRHLARSRTRVPDRLCCCASDDDRRSALERYVARVYSAAHGARLTHFLDRLLGLSDDRGRLLGVIGTELGRESNRFFLESYLDDPIEQVLSEKRGSRVDRQELAEVGNLAGPCGMGSELVGTLAGWLGGAGVPWAVFTATAPLRQLFHRVGVPLIDLAPADGRRLADQDLADWGRYYATEPRVVVASVPVVREACRSHLVEHARRLGLAVLPGRAA